MNRNLSQTAHECQERLQGLSDDEFWQVVHWLKERRFEAYNKD